MRYLDDVALVDHHCHGVLTRDLDRPAFEALLSEASASHPLGGSPFDSAVGFAVRRWCPAVLDLPAHSAAEDYLARRAELGTSEVTRRFLAAAGIDTFLVDTGYAPEPLTSPAELAGYAGGAAYEIVRLETVAEQVITAGPADFAEAFREALHDRTRDAVACKSIAAYRVGLDLSADRPTDAEVRAAAGRWSAAIDAGAPIRCADETLTRFLIWAGIDRGLPLQFHVGYGDADLDLRGADPLLLTDLLRATRSAGVPIMLLHNYPFQRHAGYLAQVFPHVFVDVGLAIHNVGNRAAAVIAELMELAPYGKVLFSSDAFGLPELYYLGTQLFRRGLSKVLSADGAWSAADAARIAQLVGADNARRVYRLPTTGLL